MTKSHTVAAVFTLASVAATFAPRLAVAQETPAAQHSSSTSRSLQTTDDARKDAQSNAPDAPELKDEPHSGGSVQEELEAIRERQRNK